MYISSIYLNDGVKEAHLIEETGEKQGIVFETTGRDVEKSIFELICKWNRHYVNMHRPHLIILIDVFVRISALKVGDTLNMPPAIRNTTKLIYYSSHKVHLEQTLPEIVFTHLICIIRM